MAGYCGFCGHELGAVERLTSERNAALESARAATTERDALRKALEELERERERDALRRALVVAEGFVVHDVDRCRIRRVSLTKWDGCTCGATGAEAVIAAALAAGGAG